MAWTDNQQYYCMYVVATVETECNWAATNMSDAITLGITQWWGPNACKLMRYLRDNLPGNYALLADTLKNDTEDHDATDSWWENRYLTGPERTSFENAAQDPNNHLQQQNLWFDDVNNDGSGYLATLSRLSVNTDNVKQAIFYLSIYHQSPQACRQIIQAIGGDRSIEVIRDAALNNGIVGRYVNRQNTVYRLLNEWDGESEPPDFGQIKDTNPDAGGDINNDENTLKKDSNVTYVESRGDHLILHGNFDNGRTINAWYNGSKRWIPHASNYQPPDNPNSGGGGQQVSPGTNEDVAKMLQFWIDHEKEWHYSMGAGRLDPLNTGHTDCSGGIWVAVNAVRPDIGEWLGTWTGAMLDTTPVIIERMYSGFHLDISKMRAGDLILMSHYGGQQHVDWYFGNNVCWTSGVINEMNPQHKSDDVANLYANNAAHMDWLQVNRFIDI